MSEVGLVELLEQMIGCLLVEMRKTREAMKAYVEMLQATTAQMKNQENLGSKVRSVKEKYST